MVLLWPAVYVALLSLCTSPLPLANAEGGGGDPARSFNALRSAWEATHSTWLEPRHGFPCEDEAIFPVCPDLMRLLTEEGLDTDASRRRFSAITLGCEEFLCVDDALKACYATPEDPVDRLLFAPRNVTGQDDIVCALPNATTGLAELSFLTTRGSATVEHPVMGFMYDVRELRVDGTVVGMRRRDGETDAGGQDGSDFGDGSSCSRLDDATIEVWQANEYGVFGDPVAGSLFHEAPEDGYTDPQVLGLENGDDPYLTEVARLFRQSLRSQIVEEDVPLRLRLERAGQEAMNESIEATTHEQNCHEWIRTNSSGGYSYRTVTPATLGPPQYINLRVSAPGYQILETRMYLGNDPWLDYLLRDSTNTRRDPRIVPVFEGVDESTGQRYFSTRFNVVLQPIEPSFDLEGLWRDNFGAIETKMLTAEESRVLRTTALARNAQSGEHTDTANFTQITDAAGLLSSLTLSEIIALLDTYAVPSVPEHAEFLAIEVPTFRRWGVMVGEIVYDSIRSVAFGGGFGHEEASGTILRFDPTSSLPDDAIIDWSNGERWQRITGNELPKYRFLRLQFTQTLRLDGDGAYMTLNEVEFVQGLWSTAQRLQPRVKATGPKTPPPLEVTCSSVGSAMTPCWKAFDGDAGAGSRWHSADVGRSSWAYFAAPQWIEIDVGIENGFFPSSVIIHCDEGNAVDEGSRDCPRDLTVLGSQDGLSYDTLFHRTNLTFHDFPTTTGGVFTFPYDSPIGRANGERCGSCDKWPHFTCTPDDVDITCASRYCGEDGFCAEKPSCPLGEFLQIHPEHIHEGLGEGRTRLFCRPCRSGTFGNATTHNSSDCAGLCAEGYYCLEGSTSATQHECGGPDVFCPEGSGVPVTVSTGFYSIGPLVNLSANQTLSTLEDGAEDMASAATRVWQRKCEPGYYCLGGVRTKCPVGVYGANYLLSSAACSENCIAGTYCPVGSVEMTPCPRGHYCPDGKVVVPCPAGTYGASVSLKAPKCSGLCPPGYYCEQGSSNPRATPCPAGRYGSQYGLTNDQCSGSCDPGYFCPAGSVNSTAQPCGGPDVYCPRSSPLPVTATRGYRTTGGTPSTRTSQAIVPPGHFAHRGVQYECPAGTYRGKEGMEAPFVHEFGCDGRCAKGHYCPIASTSPTMHKCPAGRYGATRALQNADCSGECIPGHWCAAASTNETNSMCPAGRYGNSSGLTSSACSHDCAYGICTPTVCAPGYYCPAASTRSTQEECGGPQWYCPAGSRVPANVSDGYYSIDGVDNRTQVAQTICEPGHYCQSGVKRECPPGRYGSESGLNDSDCSGPCKPGFYCPSASVSEEEIPCPAGRFGGIDGQSIRNCSGFCAEGYYCPENSTSVTQLECGSNDVYCPEGSPEPVPVQAGFYSAGGNASTRHREVECTLGSYCDGGVRLNCPAGRYGNETGLSSPLCSGPCRPGYYCPPASTQEDQNPCPPGRYGNEQGLGDRTCSGTCPNPSLCPLASVSSIGNEF